MSGRFGYEEQVSAAPSRGGQVRQRWVESPSALSLENEIKIQNSRFKSNLGGCVNASNFLPLLYSWTSSHQWPLHMHCPHWQKAIQTLQLSS